MTDNQVFEIIERYVNGEMTRVERAKFDILRKEDANIERRVREHQQFISVLKQYAERVDLENRLDAIQSEIDVHTLKESLMTHPSWIVQLWRHHHSKISVAATVALFIMVSVMFFKGSFNNNNSQMEQLKNNVNQLKKSDANNKNSINAIKQIIHADNYSGTGTGFAITADGLIATNYHVIKGVDSVYVQNADGKSFKAEILWTEPATDIAILKIIDPSFKGLGAIPYSFKLNESDLAETISTYGYPGGKAEYHNGYLSSDSGLKGDSVHYQISIPINPGNSGGPLWDDKGNIIGITDSKQAQAEGEHFAIKSRYLIDAIHNIPADSLDDKIVLNKKNTLSGLNNVQRVKKEKDFVFMIKTYN